MTRCSPLSWLVRAQGGGRGTRHRQLALVVADARTPGREGNTRQAARPGRGWFAHAGAEGGHVTRSSRRSWPVRARRAGGGTLDRQGAPAVVGSHTLGRGRSYLTAEMPWPVPWLCVARLCTPGREDGRWTRQRAPVVACWRTPGREVGR